MSENVENEFKSKARDKLDPKFAVLIAGLKKSEHRGEKEKQGNKKGKREYRNKVYEKIRDVNSLIYIQKLDMPEKQGQTTAYVHLKSEEQANILLNEKKLQIEPNHYIRFHKYDIEKEKTAREKSQNQLNKADNVFTNNGDFPNQEAGFGDQNFTDDSIDDQGISKFFQHPQPNNFVDETDNSQNVNQEIEEGFANDQYVNEESVQQSSNILRNNNEIQHINHDIEQGPSNDKKKKNANVYINYPDYQWDMTESNSSLNEIDPKGLIKSDINSTNYESYSIPKSFNIANITLRDDDIIIPESSSIKKKSKKGFSEDIDLEIHVDQLKNRNKSRSDIERELEGKFDAKKKAKLIETDNFRIQQILYQFKLSNKLNSFQEEVRKGYAENFEKYTRKLWVEYNLNSKEIEDRLNIKYEEYYIAEAKKHLENKKIEIENLMSTYTIWAQHIEAHQQNVDRKKQDLGPIESDNIFEN